MSTPEIHSLSSTTSSTTSPTSSTEAITFSWIGREITTSFEIIGSAISNMFSNIMQNSTDTSRIPTSLSEEVAITKLPSAILDIVEGYCDRMDELVKYLRDKKDIPQDLLKYAAKVEFLDITKVSVMESYPPIYATATIASNLDYFKNVKSLRCIETTSYISKKIANLEKLEHLEIISLKHDSMLDTVTERGKLKSIILDLCPHITTVGISYIARCKDIHTIKIKRSGMLDDGLKMLTELANLTHLDISNNQNITDAGLGYIGAMTKLKRLEMRNMNDSSESHITDIGIQSISNCKELEHLDLKGCNGITQDVLHSISLLPKIKTLDLSSNFDRFCTDDSLITAPLVGCKTLTYLDLSFCNKINKAEITNIAKISDLEFLGLVRCECIEEGFLELLYPLKKLKKLSIYGTNVTAAEIESIKKEIPGLTVML